MVHHLVFSNGNVDIVPVNTVIDTVHIFDYTSPLILTTSDFLIRHLLDLANGHILELIKKFGWNYSAIALIRFILSNL